MRSLVAEGKGAKEIGRILGRTPVAIDNRKKLLGICNTLKPCEPKLLLFAEVIKFRMADSDVREPDGGRERCLKGN